MTAQEANKLAFENSKKMTAIYQIIEKAARTGNTSVAISTDMASKAEIEVLRARGFKAGYENHEIDGGQFILIQW